MILKFNEITEMSFHLKQTFNLKNKDNLEINSRRHASVIVKKKKEGDGVEEAGRVDARYYESGKGYYENGKEKRRFRGD